MSPIPTRTPLEVVIALLAVGLVATRCGVSHFQMRLHSPDSLKDPQKLSEINIVFKLDIALKMRRWNFWGIDEEVFFGNSSDICYSNFPSNGFVFLIFSRPYWS